MEKIGEESGQTGLALALRFDTRLSSDPEEQFPLVVTMDGGTFTPDLTTIDHPQGKINACLTVSGLYTTRDGDVHVARLAFEADDGTTRISEEHLSFPPNEPTE